MINSIKNPNEDTSGVYMIYCVLNKKAYIGESVNIHRRFAEHRSNLKLFSKAKIPTSLRGRPSPQLYEDCKNYGKGFFLFLVLEYCERSKLNEREAYYIRSVAREDLYNQVDFWVGKRHSEMTKQKISDKNKGRRFGATLAALNSYNSKPSRAKLNRLQVFEIKREILKGTPLLKLAKKFEVNFCTIVDIAAGRGWKYISHKDGSYIFPLEDHFEEVCKFSAWPKSKSSKSIQEKLT